MRITCGPLGRSAAETAAVTSVYVAGDVNSQTHTPSDPASEAPFPAAPVSAAIYSLLGSAKLNGIDPEAYLNLVLRRIADHPINRGEVLTL
jgi:hypothetical protein